MPPKSRSTKSLPADGSLTATAYRKLEELIVTLQIPPGSLVSEPELAARLGIGRTPIREAMQRLARERLIRVMPSRGCTVTEVSVDEQLKLLELRRELEALVARTAATRATAQERQRFTKIAAGFRTALAKGDFDAFRDLDADFNDLCESACRNELISSAIRRINPLARRFWFIHHGKSLPETGVQAHAEMAEAIGRGDAAKAVAASNKLCDFIEDTTRKSLVFGTSKA
ncbi:GntR family transcriptional regulator [Bradyrhizobium sp. 14AA]